MSAAGLNSAIRGGCAIGIYRSILNLALLSVAFREFPSHRLAIGLAVLAFGQGLAGLGAAQSIASAQQNRLDDLAERKTRHAILLASDESRGEYHFWSEVDRRVAEETGPAEKSAPWWAQAGLVLANVGGYLALDLVMVGIAAALAS